MRRSLHSSRQVLGSVSVNANDVCSGGGVQVEVRRGQSRRGRERQSDEESQSTAVTRLSEPLKKKKY